MPTRKQLVGRGRSRRRGSGGAVRWITCNPFLLRCLHAHSARFRPPPRIDGALVPEPFWGQARQWMQSWDHAGMPGPGSFVPLLGSGMAQPGWRILRSLRRRPVSRSRTAPSREEVTLRPLHPHDRCGSSRLQNLVGGGPRLLGRNHRPEASVTQACAVGIGDVTPDPLEENQDFIP
jgi:hypothetical protein